MVLSSIKWFWAFWVGFQFSEMILRLGSEFSTDKEDFELSEMIQDSLPFLAVLWSSHTPMYFLFLIVFVFPDLADMCSHLHRPTLDNWGNEGESTECKWQWNDYFKLHRLMLLALGCVRSGIQSDFMPRYSTGIHIFFSVAEEIWFETLKMVKWFFY